MHVLCLIQIWQWLLEIWRYQKPNSSFVCSRYLLGAQGGERDTTDDLVSSSNTPAVFRIWKGKEKPLQTISLIWLHSSSKTFQPIHENRKSWIDILYMKDLLFCFLPGFFVCGDAHLVSSAVAADLGQQEGVRGNALATVTGIVDGTGTIGAAIGQVSSSHKI